MPLYLANWGNLSFTLLTAEDDGDLEWKLDEMGAADLDKCIEYYGPICFDFRLDVDIKIDRDPKSVEPIVLPSQVSIENYEHMIEEPKFILTDHKTESGMDMWRLFMKHAMPHLHDYYESLYDGEFDGMPEKAVSDKLKAALLKDLEDDILGRMGIDDREN